MQRNLRFRYLQHIFGMVLLLAVSPCLGQGLPPEIQVDRLLVQVERETSEGEHGSALITMERILDIYEEHALEIPAAFWFRQAGVLQTAGLHERAIEAATQYLRQAGREGEHYQAALLLLDAVELHLARAEREAAARTAARAAAIAAAVPEMVSVPAAPSAWAALPRKHKQGGKGTTRYPDDYLYDKLGLVRLTVTTRNLPWAKA